MKKKELKKEKPLYISSSMVTAARGDLPEKRKRNCWFYVGHYVNSYFHYKYRLFIKARLIEGNILQVSMWFRESVMKEHKLGDYEVYLDKENGAFITYVTSEGRWSNAKIGYLNFPHSFSDGDKVWMDSKTRKLIIDYLDNGESGLEAIHKFQLQVREEELVKRDKRLTDPWDRMQDLVPDIPDGFREWIMKYPQKMNYIVYEYEKGGAKEGWCSFCGQIVPINKPAHKKKDVCKKCKRKITYLSRGKSATVHQEDTAQLIQKTDVGIIVRSFDIHKRYQKGSLTHPVVSCTETTRTFYNSTTHHRETFYYENYKQRQMRWVSADYWDGMHYYWSYGRSPREATITYLKNLGFLKNTEFKYAGLQEILKHSSINPCRYLDAYRVLPSVEKLVKIGLYGLVADVLNASRECEIFRNGKAPHEILQISKEELRLLKAAGDSLMKLSMIKFMRGRSGATKMTPIQLNKLVQYDKGKELAALYKHTTIHKALKYIESQKNFKAGEYHDYLSMCKELQYDLNNSFILFPKDWKRAHDEIAEEHNAHKVEIEARKKSKQSLKIEQRYEETLNMYGFKYKKLEIVVPKNALEIIKEGHNNHHCVATYVDRVADGNTTILFVRERKNSTYYTMEVRDNKIIQCRTKFNKSYTEDEVVKEFVEEFDKKVLEPLRMYQQQKIEKARAASAEIDQMVLLPAI